MTAMVLLYDLRFKYGIPDIGIIKSLV